MGAGPDILLCMGATKAGTTWLHDQLSAHPECHLRTIKEYHYFSTSTPAQWDRMIAATQREIADLSAQLFAQPNTQANTQAKTQASAYDRQRLRDLTSWLPMISRRVVDAAAFAAYLHNGAREERPGARLVGDFTPAYSVASAQLLAPATALPRLRVLYLIRDPLARLWSHLRMLADRLDAARFDQAAPALLQRLIDGDCDQALQAAARRGDYAANLTKLRRIFGPRLLVMFSEDVFTRVGFGRLQGALGLSPRALDPGRQIHVGRNLPIPPKLRARALAFLRPQYEFVQSEFASLPQAWRENLAQMASTPLILKAM